MDITLLEFVDALFKGVGQVQFHDSFITGIFFLTGIALYSRRLALLAFVGSVVGTLTGMALGANEYWITFGLFGFNSVLTAEALYLFVKPTRDSMVYNIIGVVATAIAMAFLTVFFKPWNLPALTGPFNIITFVFLFAVATQILRPSDSFGWWKPWPTFDEKWTPVEFIKTVFRGMAQVMFCDDWRTGVLFFIGFTLGGYFTYPWRFGEAGMTLGFPYGLGGVVAFVGSFIGTSVAIAFKADINAVKHGLYGYNSVLTALALFGVFLHLTPTNFIYMAFWAAVTTIMMAAWQEIYRPYGIPPLTWPFCLITWIALWAIQLFPGVFT